jgi:uncharacterized protein YbaR (Trm112 family)
LLFLFFPGRCISFSSSDEDQNQVKKSTCPYCKQKLTAVKSSNVELLLIHQCENIRGVGRKVETHLSSHDVRTGDTTACLSDVLIKCMYSNDRCEVDPRSFYI